MKPDQDPIQTVLRKLYGKPCWNVQQGYASFLTFEFGNPHLEIREPIRIRRGSPRVRKDLAKRDAWVHGDWHLWIYCCNWTILQDGERLAASSSRPSRIAYAARQLQGQALVSVAVEAEAGRSKFDFDFGGRLETRRNDNASEQWMLFDPCKYVLTIRADGRYSYHLGNKPCAPTEWKLRKRTTL